MIYLYTDTHINHWMLEHSGQRPQGFSELILQHWQEIVHEDDLVIHLGDIAFHGVWSIERLLAMPGRKILVRGNHDTKSLGRYMAMGFAFACDTFTMQAEGINILFSHRPIAGHTADINIHGHQHSLALADTSRLYLPLALEYSAYYPIIFDHKLLGRLRSWVDRKHVPTEKEIRASHQRTAQLFANHENH